MATAFKTHWQCGQCKELHQTEGDAEECCQPVVVEVFSCEICLEVYQDREDAETCCADTEAARIAERRALVEALERAGQSRLFK